MRLQPKASFEVRVQPESMTRFAAQVLRALGVGEENATTLTAALVSADLQGIQTHGMNRLPMYAERIRRGLIDTETMGRVVRRHGSIESLDGENGIGQVLAARAMRDAVEIAREFGVGMVGVRRSNHFGVAGYYCEQAAAAGMLGFAFTNSPKGVPPWNGRTPYFGTNPIAAAFPVSGRDPIVIDLSTSVTARGNIIMAAQGGEPIPPDWAIDHAGHPTTDAEAALQGAILPMAGPKGYALALLVEVLAGVLTGAAFGPHVRNMYTDWTAGSGIGHLFMAIDPGGFGPSEAFAGCMAAMAEEIEAVPPAPGTAGPRLPGARRHESLARSMLEGLTYPPFVWDELVALGAKTGVEAPDILS